MIEKPEHTIHSPTVYDFGGCTKKYENFLCLMEYHGMIHGVFPTKIKLLAGQCIHSAVRTWNPCSFHICTSAVSSFTILGCGHERTIKAFEVILGDVKNFRVGWTSGSNRSTQNEFQLTSPFGRKSDGISLEVAPNCSCRIVASPICNKDGGIPSVAAEKGAVIRCQQVQISKDLDTRYARFMWYLNETEIKIIRNCDYDSYSPSTRCNHDQWECWDSRLAPAFAGHGEWWVSNIEFNK
jgi:hypothetical protein